MSTITVDKLLENGVHYGHRASRWNPKMRPYIHGKRNDIHIIDLKQTVRGLLRARHFLEQMIESGEDVGDEAVVDAYLALIRDGLGQRSR